MQEVWTIESWHGASCNYSFHSQTSQNDGMVDPQTDRKQKQESVAQHLIKLFVSQPCI